MNFRKFTLAVCLAASFVCLSSQQALAAVYGQLEYTDNGSSITITRNFFWGPGSPAAPENLEIPASIEGKPVTKIGDGAFKGARITNISIPSGVSIGNSAFYGSETLQSVTMADGPSTIGENAFRGCYRLKNIRIATGTTSIGGYAFSLCRVLESITIPATVTHVGETPFWNCNKLSNIVLSEGLVEVYDNMLSGCGELKALVIPSSVTAIGKSAFSSCYKLESLTIPESVKSIRDSAFAGSGLRSIEVPASVEQLGKGLFGGCWRLASVKLPGNVSEIGDRMFSGCESLTEITIPDKLVRIGERAFYGTGLCTIALPKSVREIADQAFSDSYYLESVRFKGNAPVVGKNAFSKNPKFKFFITEGATGYTVPKWNGYPVSLPQAEIAVQVDDDTLMENGKFVFKFNNVIVGKKSTVKRVTIVNVGSLKLTGLNAKMKGGSSSDYTVKYLGKPTLAPGKKAVLEFRFSPKKAGSRQTNLNVYSSDKDENPLVFGLKGTGLTILK